ncbi:DUF523 domain-containing protein [candidate division KSB1 bacterium]|nr:DUF523 domain-containing protein [candidate division KSB1 bacterium]
MEKSPSCGVHCVYDGRFCGHLVGGEGITTALLQQNGIRVFSEQELKAVAVALVQVEKSGGSEC